MLLFRFQKVLRGFHRLSCTNVSVYCSVPLSFPADAMNETKLCVCVCYRNYALRRVRDAFKANRNVEDPKAVERLMEEGWQTLALIQRQV